MRQVILSGAFVLLAVPASGQQIPELTWEQWCLAVDGKMVDAHQVPAGKAMLALMERVKIAKSLTVCRIPYRQHPVPLVGTRTLGDQLFLIISEDFERMSRASLDMLMAHEVAHWMPLDVPYPVLSRDQLFYESVVDRRAMELVGREVFMAGIEEVQRVMLAALSDAKDRVKATVSSRRQLLQ